jgi:hypothetical protein
VLKVENIQSTAGLKNVIHYDTVDALPYYSNTTISGGTAHIEAHANGELIGTGYIGFQRYWDIFGVEKPGYEYIVFDTWNITGLTGEQAVTIDYSREVLGTTMTFSALNKTDSYPALACFSNYGGGGNYAGQCQNNFVSNSLGRYYVTKPAGLGIQGNFIKDSGSSSKIVVYDGTTYLPITGERFVSSEDYYFNVPSQSIFISDYDQYGYPTTSTILFTATAPTVTPTITVSPSPSPIPTVTETGGPVPTGTISPLDFSNGTFTFLDYSNGHGIPNVYVAYCAQNWCIEGYTNQSGMIILSNLPVNVAGSLSAYNASYQVLADVRIYPEPGSVSITEYMYPLSGPTPTPSPYPTPTPTLLPSGSTRTYFTSNDGSSGARIYGIDMNLKDVNNNTWKNSSANSAGWVYIDTLPSDSIYVFFHDPTYTYLDKSATFDTDTRSGIGWTYSVPMYQNLSAPIIGNVNFYVYVADENGNPLTSASVVFCEHYSCQSIQRVGVGATILYNVTAGELVQATVSAPGYVSATAQHTVTTLDTFDSMEVQLYPIVTATPTHTPTYTPTSTPTNVPTTIPGGNATYGGFWGPFYTGFSAMGANTLELNILVAAFIVAICALMGFCAPTAAGQIFGSTGYSPSGGLVGGVLGFLMATMFGFINPIFLVIIIIFGIFIYFFFGRG